MARIDHPVVSMEGCATFLRVTRALAVGGTASPPPLSVTVVSSASTITATFSDDIAIIAPADDYTSWSVIDSSGGVLPISGTTFDGTDTIVITTGEQKNGESYTLTIPSGIVDTSTPPIAFPGPYEVSFTGVGVPPTVLLAFAMSYRSVRVTFDEAVVESEALNKSNYAITGGVYITGVTKISDTIYELSTSPMVGGTSYTITASNIHDLAGNLI